MTEHYDTERAHAERDEQQERVIVRDRRKIDPETGQIRQATDGLTEEVREAPAAGAPAAGAGAVDETVAAATAGLEKQVADLEKQLEERTADLQRVQAEYANYRRRVEREREAMALAGKAVVMNEMLPLLDDLERAEAHGDLTGAFKAVADKLVGVLEKSGLESFGAEGDAFDPSVHEAVQHTTSPDVDGPTVTTVLRRGYRLGDRVLREAMVGVTDHEPAAAQEQPEGNGPVDPPVGGELPVDTDENAR